MQVKEWLEAPAFSHRGCEMRVGMGMVAEVDRCEWADHEVAISLQLDFALSQKKLPAVPYWRLLT